MLIRHAREDDWADVVRIEQENFSPEEAATPEAIAERLDVYKRQELTSSVLTVRQVTMLVMVQVTQINLITNNNLRHSFGSVFCFILVKA